MKKLIFILLNTLLLSSCFESKYKGKYTLSTTDGSGQILYIFHTDSILFLPNDYISFIPKEDTTKTYTLQHCNIEF